MANNKITQDELVKYIMFTLKGYSYLEAEAKGDAAKLKSLENEIENIGTKRVSIANVSSLLSATVQEVIIPQLQAHSKELLLAERVIRGNAVGVDNLDSLMQELHKNKDVSDESYQYYKEHKFTISNDDFKQVAKEIDEEAKQNQAKLKEAKKAYDKAMSTDKNAVAKGTYDSDKDKGNIINLNGHRK